MTTKICSPPWRGGWRSRSDDLDEYQMGGAKGHAMMTEDAREIMFAIDRLTSAVVHLAAVTAAGVLATEGAGVPPHVVATLTYEVGAEL